LILETRISLLVATIAVVVDDSLGFLLEVSTGYLGGRFDLTTQREAYVDAARVIGGSTWRIMLRHIAPQYVAPLLVLFSLGLGGAIFTEASLSYLGVGIPLPSPSLGNMLGEQVVQAFRPAWWLVLFPGLAITAIILAANLLGDAVRDLLDPRLRQRTAER